MKTIACCLVLLVSTGLVWANGGLEGTVRDSRGHPIKSAEVRIKAMNGNVAKAVRTDAGGHYVSSDLAMGTDYRVTLIVNGTVKASLLNVRAGADKPAELSFYLRPANTSSDRHMVWIPDQPAGTHIGAGHWAELDENGRIIDRNNIDIVRMGREYVRTLEMTGARPML